MNEQTYYIITKNETMYLTSVYANNVMFTGDVGNALKLDEESIAKSFLEHVKKHDTQVIASEEVTYGVIRNTLTVESVE